MGKTALAITFSHYISERQKFKDGVIFVRLHGCNTVDAVHTKICLSVNYACKDGLLLELKKRSSSRNSGNLNLVMQRSISARKSEQSEQSISAFEFLKDKEILIVLDNCEDVIAQNEEGF